MMENRGVGGNVDSTVARHEFPDEVVARLDYVARPTDVLAALLVRMEFGATACLAQGYEAGFRCATRRRDVGVVRPLEVEEGVLERVGARRLRVYPRAHPSVGQR